jgi:hypothetical protein
MHVQTIGVGRYKTDMHADVFMISLYRPLLATFFRSPSDINLQDRNQT